MGCPVAGSTLGAPPADGMGAPPLGGGMEGIPGGAWGIIPGGPGGMGWLAVIPGVGGRAIAVFNDPF